MAISDLVGKVFSSQFIEGTKQVTPVLSFMDDRSDEIREKGDGLIIGLTQGLTSVADYPAVGTDITYSQLSPAKVEFAVDKQKYVAFEVEDTDRAQLAFDLFTDGARQAGIEFASQLAADFRTMIAGAAAAKTYSQEIDKTGDTAAQREAMVFEFLDIQEYVRQQGYSQTPTCLLHPSTRKRILTYLIADKGMSLPNQAEAAFVDARLSSIFDINMVVDYGATIDSTDENDNATSYIFIPGRTFAYGAQLSNMEQMRSPGRFANRWRALNTYGMAAQELRSFVDFEQTVEA